MYLHNLPIPILRILIKTDISAEKPSSWQQDRAFEILYDKLMKNILVNEVMEFKTKKERQKYL